MSTDNLHLQESHPLDPPAPLGDTLINTITSQGSHPIDPPARAEDTPIDATTMPPRAATHLDLLNIEIKASSQAPTDRAPKANRCSQCKVRQKEKKSLQRSVRKLKLSLHSNQERWARSFMDTVPDLVSLETQYDINDIEQDNDEAEMEVESCDENDGSEDEEDDRGDPEWRPELIEEQITQVLGRNISIKVVCNSLYEPVTSVFDSTDLDITCCC
ncbi:uncharacterized protein LOC5522339 isoform X1 [Nematostella vectensis]|uniref:uncharacterized protein LOC5522339 isoform X1 n=2 Tax=Nematostella vectensis TaxID=45351 RepID=UPI00207773F3|nr:uncharacterized protein LOC5522339 isoform X1 [Nematostella vectensis]